MDGHSARKATVIAQPTEFSSCLPATFAPQSNSVMNLIGSPCSATMDSPLFYELDAFSENNNISADKLKDSHRSTYHQLTSFSQNVQTQQPQQQHLQQAQQSAQHLNNVSAVQTPVSSSARGLAPVRISSAVFGNARPADLSEVSNYSDLADINTPEYPGEYFRGHETVHRLLLLLFGASFGALIISRSWQTRSIKSFLESAGLFAAVAIWHGRNVRTSRLNQRHFLFFRV